MRGIQFAITVFVFIGIIFVMNWLFGKYDISYGSIKEEYYKIGSYTILIGWIAMLYQQRLRVVGLPEWMCIAPFVYGVCFLFFRTEIPHMVMLGIHAVNVLFFLALIFKRATR